MASLSKRNIEFSLNAEKLLCVCVCVCSLNAISDDLTLRAAANAFMCYYLRHNGEPEH